MNAPVTEAELHAWVDGQLPPARRAAVDAYLSQHPAEAARLQAYRAHNAGLRALFNPVLDEPVPRALQRRPLQLPHWPLRMAAMLALTLAGGGAGWWLHGAAQTGERVQQAALALPARAALAHAVYTPEVRHPVEVGADQQAHLVAWLSKRLGAQLKPPLLTAQGYTLEGGRLLPGQSGPVAQFMYRDGGGVRLTLYVSTEQKQHRDTAFRFAQEGEVSVFYWLDGQFGYALSGNLDKAALATLANAVYAQLEPSGE
ncbi:Transmembrane transcriptional regulator (anti-sigma factor RsiW) [Duganella sacchari]|uniref:Transmembrane transcriptional regulator (Anti-sigma factor RsiW) n=1 Tax=Duganella sacchari TaxID=551987 RepID=A0A1M7QWC5_9BURK|nr:anti-sigma factor [Duganella sacchari]SHN36276.1 Transmembrane transcriptional regulator (anti-sigma factor RsiW) [Duganella sacchari]